MTVSPMSRAVRQASEPNNPCPGETFGEEANTCGQLQRTGTQRPLFPAGVQEETQQPPAQTAGRRCQHSCPRWGGSQREALWVEGVQSCLAEVQGKVQGSSGKTSTYQPQKVHACCSLAPHKACWERKGASGPGVLPKTFS